jgi:hypothetical protein
MTDKSHEDLVVPLIAGPLDVDWATEGDEWEHHLHSRISEHFGGDASMHMSGIPLESPDYYEFSVTEPALRSRLRIVIEDTGSSAFLVSPRDVEEDERELWLEAVRAATERVGSEHPDFEWFSILANEPVHGRRAQALSGPAQISDLEVAPAGVPYWE